jgi:hypothetical protein
MIVMEKTGYRDPQTMGATVGDHEDLHLTRAVVGRSDLDRDRGGACRGLQLGAISRFVERLFGFKILPGDVYY